MRRKPDRRAKAAQSVSGPQQGRHDVHDGARRLPRLRYMIAISLMEGVIHDQKIDGWLRHNVTPAQDGMTNS